MKTIGTREQGSHTVGLSYTYAERFWTVTGTRTQRVGVDDEYNAIHLMVSVWHTESETVLPIDSGLRVRVTRDGERVTERAFWPMLSQQMGFHFGDNVQFPSQDEYTLVVDIGTTSVEGNGGLEDTFGEAGTVSFDFRFYRTIRNEIGVSGPLDGRGEQDALAPMGMFPLSVAPSEDNLPGRVIGESTSGDAVFLVTATDTADGTYVTVSPRTPYNRYVLPMMAQSMTVERNGATLFEGPLSAAIGPDRGYHYRALLERHVESGDELIISVDAPPQVGRHVGYETAFLEMPDVTMTA
ncbi:MAG: hypothetical protein V5A55_11670 [Halovenus sp.]